jgi:hypothetical protein
VRVDRLLQSMPVVGAEGAMEPVPEPERRNPLGFVVSRGGSLTSARAARRRAFWMFGTLKALRRSES